MYQPRRGSGGNEEADDYDVRKPATLDFTPHEEWRRHHGRDCDDTCTTAYLHG